MIRKSTLLDAIGDLNHDVLTLSFRVIDLEQAVEKMQKATTKAKTETKSTTKPTAKSATRRGRPPKNAKM